MPLAVGAALIVTIVARAQADELVVDGVTRTFAVHMPAGRAPATPVPLVLAFHGGGGAGRSMVGLTGFNRLSDRDGFIVAYPDARHRHWNDGRATIVEKNDDVGFVAALIDLLERRYPIDRHRIFAAGISNGGMFTARLACEMADRIAAVAIVAATMPQDLAPRCAPARPISVLQINGTEDPLMPYRGGTVGRVFGGGLGGRVLSVDETMALWARLDQCRPAAAPVALLPIAPSDGTKVRRIAYEGCAGKTDLVLYEIDGGGHAWPGGPQYFLRAVIGKASRQIDASAAITRFFAAHPML